MKASGSNKASLGPAKVVSEPVTFQYLCVCLRGCKRRKAAHAGQARSNMLTLRGDARRAWAGQTLQIAFPITFSRLTRIAWFIRIANDEGKEGMR
jgi:hypothetical protein